MDIRMVNRAPMLLNEDGNYPKKLEPSPELLEAAKFVGGFAHHGKHLVVFTHIDLQRQAARTEGAHFFGHAVYGAGKLGMRFGRFGGDDDIGAGARAGEGNRAADTARGAGD